MRFFRIPMVLLILLTGAASSAQAQSSASASKGPAVTTGRFEAFMSAFYAGISRGSTQLSLAPGFQWVLFPKLSWLQVGGDVTYQKISLSGGSTTNFMVMAGPTGNLGGATLNDSFFFSFGVAIKGGSGDGQDAAAESPNGVGFYFISGKRFPIGGAWTFRPSMGIVAAGSTGVLVRPFAVSYHF